VKKECGRCNTLPVQTRSRKPDLKGHEVRRGATLRRNKKENKKRLLGDPYLMGPDGHAATKKTRQLPEKKIKSLGERFWRDVQSRK